MRSVVLFVFSNHSIDTVACLQIHTCMQQAVSIVFSYPWIPVKHKMLEVMAAQRGQPQFEQYMEGDGLDDVQHAVNWQLIPEYLSKLNINNLAQHVSLIDYIP